VSRQSIEAELQRSAVSLANRAGLNAVNELFLDLTLVEIFELHSTVQQPP
jgi:hypothetical protein